MRYSALVLSHNDACCIGRCLRSLRALPRVVVVDSGSTDSTLGVIRRHPNVQLLHHPFTNFAEQRNWGLAQAFSPGEWILHLDADEELTPALHREILALPATLKRPACNIPSLTIWRGKPIPRASSYPVYQTRLTRGQFRFVQVGHGQKAPVELGALPQLRAPYRHHPLDKGLSDWLCKHDRYARMEAAAPGRSSYKWRDALRDPIARRQTLKAWLRRVPGAPRLLYLHLLVARGGILEGPEAWEYARLRWLYEHLVALRRREHRRFHPPQAPLSPPH